MQTKLIVNAHLPENNETSFFVLFGKFVYKVKINQIEFNLRKH